MPLISYERVRTVDPAKLSANFSLKEKLPRDVWLKFGGYPGRSLLCHSVQSQEMRKSGVSPPQRIGLDLECRETDKRRPYFFAAN